MIISETVFVANLSIGTVNEQLTLILLSNLAPG